MRTSVKIVRANLLNVRPRCFVTNHIRRTIIINVTQPEGLRLRLSVARVNCSEFYLKRHEFVVHFDAAKSVVRHRVYTLQIRDSNIKNIVYHNFI